MKDRIRQMHVNRLEMRGLGTRGKHWLAAFAQSNRNP
jgi:hypothetical protein